MTIGTRERSFLRASRSYGCCPGPIEGHCANSSPRPVPNYVPRPRLHQKMKGQLHDLMDDRVEDVRILVVWGLGEAGKSWLALKYIREYRGDYDAVFSIEAGSKESIERDYVQIYPLLYRCLMDAGHGMVKVQVAVRSSAGFTVARGDSWWIWTVRTPSTTIETNPILTWDISWLTRPNCTLLLRHGARRPRI